MKNKKFCPECRADMKSRTYETKLVQACRHCDYIDWDQPSIGVCGRLLHKETVLLCRSSLNGSWTLPGGHLEKHESLEEGLAREFKEETNLDIIVKGYLGSFSSQVEGHITVFFDVVAQPHKMRPGSDVEELQFFPLDSLPEICYITHNKVIGGVR